MSLDTPLATSIDSYTALSVGAADSNDAVPQSYTFTVTRQTLIRVITTSLIVAAMVIAVTVAAVLLSSPASSNTAADTTADSGRTVAVSDADDEGDCPAAHILTEGPYWVDEKLNRSNITAGEIGLPLDLYLTVYNASKAGCFLSVNSMVDIWHTNADGGLYSDIQSEGTKGMTWLRGYQMTDRNGVVHFRTLYPSWYRGRTTHIHVRIRLFDASGRTTYDSTTQLFFDDDVSTPVFATYPYNKRTGRDTYNRNDGLYRADLQLTLKGDLQNGYTGFFVLGLPFIR